jgi:hypothetical protein
MCATRQHFHSQTSKQCFSRPHLADKCLFWGSACTQRRVLYPLALVPSQIAPASARGILDFKKPGKHTPRMPGDANLLFTISQLQTLPSCEGNPDPHCLPGPAGKPRSEVVLLQPTDKTRFDSDAVSLSSGRRHRLCCPKSR